MVSPSTLGSVGGGEELWRHKQPQSTQMATFLREINDRFGVNAESYDDLHRWSVNDIASFWSEVWRFTGMRVSKMFDKVVESEDRMFPRPLFFPGAKLNFAENLLYPSSAPHPSSPAIIAATEASRESLTWSELRSRVQKCQKGLQALGVGVGDRVAGYLGNHADAVVIMLAATSLGAVWTAVSPDSGVKMVLDRLLQISPKVFCVDSSQFYNGKDFDILPKAAEIVSGLDTLEATIVLPAVPADCKRESLTPSDGSLHSFRDFGGLQQEEMKFVQLEPDHPVYILYSSGTTGAPKCIVHGAIGTLVQHKKEHVLHCDIRTGQRLFYFTTVTWMMWHWLVSGLASGATLVLYDGSPMRYRTNDGKESVADDLAMPRLIEELQIEHFGTSAKYLSLLEQKGIFPRQSPTNLNLASLKSVFNTASPLAPSTFRYVYQAFGSDLMLSSITGGTDIVSLFGAGCPIAPVYAGEVQVPGLGMAIRAFSEEGKDVTESGQAGELVCVKPFPCQPVFFWPRTTEGESRYEKSYFQRFRAEVNGEPIWHHGDFVQFVGHAHGRGIIMAGRSDGVLNPQGIRFGSSEVYNVILDRFGGRIEDSLCVGRRREDEADETVVLFLKMGNGHALDESLMKEIRAAIRSDLSARHVPTIIDACPDIPVTINGKKIEGEVKKIISGHNVKTSASVANIECLEYYKKWAQQH